MTFTSETHRRWKTGRVAFLGVVPSFPQGGRTGGAHICFLPEAEGKHPKKFPCKVCGVAGGRAD